VWKWRLESSSWGWGRIVVFRDRGQSLSWPAGRLVTFWKRPFTIEFLKKIMLMMNWRKDWGQDILVGLNWYVSHRRQTPRSQFWSELVFASSFVFFCVTWHAARTYSASKVSIGRKELRGSRENYTARNLEMVLLATQQVSTVVGLLLSLGRYLVRRH
jgi:hypothetical protein